jgi:hypothetical protein
MVKSFQCVATAVAFWFTACNSNNKTATDAAFDANTNVPDAPAPCRISAADFGSKGTLTGQSVYDQGTGSPAAPIISVVGQLKTAEPKDLLIVELLAGFAPFGTKTSPLPPSVGTFALVGSQLNYSTCGVCVRAIAARTGGPTGVGGGDDFMATSGTLKITQVGTKVGDKITLELSDATLEQVKIDANYVSTPLHNNCTTKVASATFTGTMMAVSSKPRTSTDNAGERLFYQLSREK